MTEDRGERIHRIFSEAIRLPAEQRGAFLDEACSDDSELRAKIEALLANASEPEAETVTTPRDDEPTTVVTKPAPTDPVAGVVGQTIGRYTIKSVIASGGMGTVYEAEQENPRRRVALKVIKPGVISPGLLHRFQIEAQILGKLQHPGIAQIFEAGTFDQGAGAQPFFAMEFVEGKTLTEHVRTKNLPNHERLELVARICDAVLHAHQRGVIHRDLKPGNILVDATGQPKILDFGVARATDADIQTTTLRTDIGQLVGTVPYMSPEQAAGDPDDLDTRSDVYALGVVAYELLTDRLPYDVKKKLIHEAVRVICDENPTPLSSVNRTFRGDVDIIVGKALAKEKQRRYQTAGDFAADIRRYLAHEPIEARPPSATYQIGKFARRNKTLVGGIVAVFVVLLAGIVGTGLALVRALAAEDAAKTNLIAANKANAEATQARDAEAEQRRLAERNEAEARTEAAKATQVADFTREMLSGIDPATAGDLDKTLMRMVLDNAAARIATDLADQPEVEASIRATIGLSFVAIGEFEAAEPHLEQACTLNRGVLGDEHPETLRSVNNLANLYARQGRYDEAEPLYLETLEKQRRVRGDEHPDTLHSANSLASLNNLASLYQNQGRYDEAEPLYVETLETRRRVLGDEHPATLGSVKNLANLYRNQGRYDEAEPLYLLALETQRRVLGDEHPHTLGSMHSLAVLYARQGRYGEAEPLFLETLETHRRVLGDEHPTTLGSVNNLAVLYRRQGRYDEAELLYLLALETQRRVLGDEHPDTLTSANSLANLYADQGRYDEAEPLNLLTLETHRRVLGDEHPHTLTSANNLAVLYADQGRYDEAGPLYLETLETQRRVLGDEHPDTLRSVNNLANLYRNQGRYDEAEPLWLLALETQRRVLGDEHPETLRSVGNLALLYRSQGRYDEAERLHLLALEAHGRVLGDEHPETLLSASNLAFLYARQGRYDEAEPLYLLALEKQRRVLGDEHLDTLSSVGNLAQVYAAMGRDESSRPLVRELLGHSLKAARAPGAGADAKNSCAWTLLTCEPADLREPQAALTLAIEANEMTGHGNPGYLDTLALACHMTGDNETAVETQRKALSLLPMDAPGRDEYQSALARYEAALAAESEEDTDADADAGTELP